MIGKLLEAKILNVIDYFGWKHSWHLPKDSYGSIDWNNPLTISKSLEVCEHYEMAARQHLDNCQQAVAYLKSLSKETPDGTHS